AAIFSAVLVTLIVDSKTLLEQDKTEVLVDAVVFLMNNLANGTHKPYIPPKFQPSTQSILVNCFFFASLCLSIATALAAVLAMQWVTDYGAVTRRAGSTPEERVTRRHFRYQGGQDWRMDAIIGALPIALHLSVLLFFVGLIVWMWDAHHSVFAVVVVCGVVAALFYIVTTLLAIFYPSCPYRTPLASWVYTLLHLLTIVILPSSWVTVLTPESKNNVEKGETADIGRASKLRQFIIPLLSRLTAASLLSRDDLYIRNPDKILIANSLVWLSDQLSISPDIYQRLLTFVDGFSSVVDVQAHLRIVPWTEILRTLGVVYQSFIEMPGVNEKEFVEFTRRTHCLSQSGMSEILYTVAGDSEGVQVGDLKFPIHLLRAWTKSVSSHTSDASQKQRFMDEVVLQELISDISPTPQDLVATWYELLSDEKKTIQRILPKLLSGIGAGIEGKEKRRLDTALYLISTGRLPWESTMQFHSEDLFHSIHKDVPSNALFRRLQAMGWVHSLIGHPQVDDILKRLSDFTVSSPRRLLLPQHKLTDEEKTELEQVDLRHVITLSRPESVLHRALYTFDQLLTFDRSTADIEDLEEAQRKRMECLLAIIWGDLAGLDVSLDPESLFPWDRNQLRSLSHPILQLIACATFGVEWRQEGMPDMFETQKSAGELVWRRASYFFFTNPPFFDGDHTNLWTLRLQLWFQIDVTAFNYLLNVISGIDSLVCTHIRVQYRNAFTRFRQKCFEQGIESTRLGIDKAGDFVLALVHLYFAYSWDGAPSISYNSIPDILIGSATAVRLPLHKDCVEHLSSVCDEINLDPTRLIRLLIELIRADINHDPRIRQPEILLDLLKHGELHLSNKDLRPFAPSCRRLIRYIRVSYQQFEDSWDEVVNEDEDDDLRPHYEDEDETRQELKATYERVIDLLGPAAMWEGEGKDVSWPRHLLRPTGTCINPFDELFDEPFEQKVEEGTNSYTSDEGKYMYDDDHGATEDRVQMQDESLLDAQREESGRKEAMSVIVEGTVE
ncbi:hypothetical protein FRC17_005943, partial [Serendipita sp. 399]